MDIAAQEARTRARSILAIASAAMLVAACAGPAAQQPAAPPQDVPVYGHVHGGPPPPAAPLRAGERFHQIGLGQPYLPMPPAGGVDEYRCFLIDPGLAEAAYLTGTQVLPQNQAIVHHAILSRVDATQVAHARTVDAAAPGEGWQCFGGTGLSRGVGEFGGESSSETYLGGWSPGHNETLLGEPAGYRIEPGTQIVLQVHYSLLTTGGQVGPTDQLSIRLRLMPGTAAVDPLKALLLPAPIELPCAAGESGPLCDRAQAIDDLVRRTGAEARTMIDQLNQLCNKGATPKAGSTQQCDFPVAEPVLLYAVGPHMHLLGRSIRVELNPGTPKARVLLDQPTYNFDNQGLVKLPQPLRIGPGDTVRVTCTHDATLRARLPQLRTVQPRYVVWGDGTSDEMCLGLLVAGTATK